MTSALKSASAKRVQQALAAAGLNAQVTQLNASTRTAREAAEALGCDVTQIVKSLIFRGEVSDQAVLALVSGANRVDESKLADAAGEPMGKATAAFVRERTGFAIGGVAPIGHPQPLATFIDADLMRFHRLWAAAGTPNALFELSADELSRLSGGKVVELKSQ